MSKRSRHDPYKSYNFRAVFAGVAVGIAALLIVRLVFPPEAVR